MSAQSMKAGHPQPFWKTRPLSALTAAEWESLCDRCGQCCLHKLEYQDTGQVVYTSVACRLLDIRTGCCRRYRQRLRVMSDCLKLTPANVRNYPWLPKTCAYRLLAEGRELPSWHPLISGDPESVHEAGISLRNRAISARFIDLEDLEAFALDL